MINDNFYKNLGISIKHQRERLNLTQQNLADKVGITLNHMGKIEVAFSKPSISTIIKIANALELSVSDLCNFQNL